MIQDKNSVFYLADKISRILLSKSRTSSYKKDKVFYKIYIRLEDQEIIYDDNEEKERIPFNNPFVEQKQDIDRSSTLYSLNGPMQFFHADVANIHFFPKSVFDPKYACFVLICFRQKFTFIRRKK